MKRLLTIFLLLGVVFFSEPSMAQDSKSITIIVNSKNPVANMKRTKLSKIFLKKITKWEDGKEIIPIDLPANSTIRKLFSKKVLKKNLSSVNNYWQQQLFSGRNIPPTIKESENEILTFVKANKNAIAYVSNPPDTKDVKVITIEFDN
ncbi:MAG: hypothetical protein DWQ05_20735 [Calditrichaeota bacterium]|nr:MAG: hypothetical protein DWQ05_20735 [Calditrichota bacterium]